MKKKYIFLTNIPTPYRTSFYNELTLYDFDFSVYYMRMTEEDRNWAIDLNTLRHPYYIDKGMYKMFGRYHFHFNPRLVLKILSSNCTDIIVGGGWNDPDVLILVTLKRLGLLNKQLHFWTEANYLTLGASNDNLIKKLVRRYVYNSTNGIQLSSGKMTEITLQKWGVRTNKFVDFPNTIEEEKYTISSSDLQKREDNILPIMFMPVRLHEQVKGILNFFTSLGNDRIRESIFEIAGEGPDRQLIEDYIVTNDLSSHIKLIGHCNTEELVKHYRKANVFVLGSFTDASPLTVIEALKMHLPLLISERCGNHFEAVDSEINGYLFDPYNPASISKAYDSLIQNRSRWSMMGNVSANIYEKIFKKRMVLKHFVDELNHYEVY